MSQQGYNNLNGAGIVPNGSQSGAPPQSSRYERAERRARLSARRRSDNTGDTGGVVSDPNTDPQRPAPLQNNLTQIPEQQQIPVQLPGQIITPGDQQKQQQQPLPEPAAPTQQPQQQQQPSGQQGVVDPRTFTVQSPPPYAVTHGNYGNVPTTQSGYTYPGGSTQSQPQQGASQPNGNGQYQQQPAGAVVPAAGPVVGGGAGAGSSPPVGGTQYQQPLPQNMPVYKRGELLSKLPGFMSKILMDEIRVHTNRSVVTVSRAAASESETFSVKAAIKDKYHTISATLNYVITLSWANRGFCIPALFFYFLIAARCAASVELENDPGWSDMNKTCKEWGERGSDYVPSMLTSILPIFLVVFYVNAAIKRYYKMYDACREMSDITDQAVGIALVDFRKHPECIKEEVRCLHLARMLVLLHTAKETYPVKSFFLPLCECFGDKAHGMLTESETKKIKDEGYSEHLAQYFVVKALNVTHAATHKGLISPPGCAARTMHLMKMMDSSQKIKSLTSMQYPPTYTYLVSTTVGISCILEIAFAGTRVGLQWNSMMFWESFLITFSLLVAQQVCLFGILGVAGEMIDPFGRDIRDFPILQMCVAPLQHTVQLLFEYQDLRDDVEANQYLTELGATETWGPKPEEDLYNRHTRKTQRFKESSMLSSEELAKVDPKQLGESYSAEAERILETLKHKITQDDDD